MSKLNFLADTWWFGLTDRFSREQFRDLAQLRRKQGFTAIQLVCGIPPEVGPLHPSAQSEVGPAWGPQGRPNLAYLRLAQDRIKILRDSDLLPVIYGAWGHQIDWIGIRQMQNWWGQILNHLGQESVVWCLTGEADLWLGKNKRIGLHGSTDNVSRPKIGSIAKALLANKLFRKVKHRTEWFFNQHVLRFQRIRAWSEVLKYLRLKTEYPILVHPSLTLGSECIFCPELLDAETIQTGHDYSSTSRLWQAPIESHRRHPGRAFINLEPWYEGIRDQFFGADQTLAYWLSMLGGASAHSYGAQGIWNGGDGKFLSHWGTQDFDEAIALETPYRLGMAHNWLTKQELLPGSGHTRLDGNHLISLGRRTENGWVELWLEPSKMCIQPQDQFYDADTMTAIAPEIAQDKKRIIRVSLEFSDQTIL